MFKGNMRSDVKFYEYLKHLLVTGVREWVNIVDILNNSVSFKSDKVIAIICEEELEK